MPLRSVSVRCGRDAHRSSSRLRLRNAEGKRKRVLSSDAGRMLHCASDDVVLLKSDMTAFARLVFAIVWSKQP